MWHANEHAIRAEARHRQKTFWREAARARHATDAVSPARTPRRRLLPLLTAPTQFWQALTLWRGA